MDTLSGGSFGAAPASKGKRIAAGVIDLIIIPVILGVILGLLLLKTPEAVRNIILVLVNILWLLIRDAVYSPGRTMVGLKLISLSGDKVTWAQALIRNILLIIPFVLVFGYVIEFVAILVKGERVADGWAKTRVVSA